MSQDGSNADKKSADQPDASAGRSAFISYSHKDERYRQRLDIWLAQLQREKLISVWHDRRILPGQDWDREIDKNLENADIVLLLISPDFLGSDYAYSREMLRAVERHESGSATVVPIILRPSDWQSSPLGSLEALPSKGRPVSLWTDRDEAWLDVVQGLRRLISGRQREAGQREAGQREVRKREAGRREVLQREAGQREVRKREARQREARQREARQREAQDASGRQAVVPVQPLKSPQWDPVVYDDLVRSAFAELVQPGRLLFNPPARMQLGQTERIEVRLARTLELDAELLKHLRGTGEPQLEDIPTAPLMAVTLKGDAFQITAYSDEEQGVTQDGITTWEFDIRALKRGQQHLVMCVSLRIPVPGQPLEHKSIPVREVTIYVQVGAPALVGQFVSRNWQWIIGTAIAIAAVVVVVLYH